MSVLTRYLRVICARSCANRAMIDRLCMVLPYHCRLHLPLTTGITAYLLHESMQQHPITKGQGPCLSMHGVSSESVQRTKSSYHTYTSKSVEVKVA